MHTETLVFVLIIIIVILIVSLVYATRATSDISQAKADKDISIAYWYLAWTVSILWLTIAGLIIGIISLFVFGPELIPMLGKSVIYALVAILAVALAIVGVMSAIAAYHIGNSAVESSVVQGYHEAITAAVTALVSIGLAIVIIFVTWHYESPATPLPSYPDYPDYSDYPSTSSYY